MNDLDTEIRRAMGELADAAPPAREPDSFRRGMDDGPTAVASGTSRWLLAAATTVVVAVVGVVLVVATSDDSPATITPSPDITTSREALTGPALLDELSGRRWVALERFDDPSPTARAPEFTVTTRSSGAVIDGFDGCNTYGGAFTIEGTTTAAGEVSSTSIACDVETLGFAGSLEMFPDATTLLLSDRDGTPVARFHDLAELQPASADDMPYTFFGDGLAGVGFGVSGVGRGGCTRVGWEESADGVSVELLEIIGDCQPDDGPLGGWLAAITDPVAAAFVTPDGILLANESSTLHLRRLPVVEPDPDGITLAAGAIFGIEPGLGTGPDDVLAEIVPRLGQPDTDTGWLPAERTVADDGTVTLMTPCPDLTDYRELHWGDLSFAFWGAGSRSLLQVWNVGDGPAIGFDVPDTNVSAAGPPTGLQTEDGVRVGDPVTAIPDRFDTSRSEQYFGSDPTYFRRVTVLSSNPAFTPGSVASPTRGGEYAVGVDDVVIGFGAQTFGC